MKPNRYTASARLDTTHEYHERCGYDTRAYSAHPATSGESATVSVRVATSSNRSERSSVASAVAPPPPPPPLLRLRARRARSARTLATFQSSSAVETVYVIRMIELMLSESSR